MATVFNLQKTTVARKMAAILADIYELIQHRTRYINTWSTYRVIWANFRQFWRAGVFDAAHFINDYAASAGFDQGCRLHPNIDVFFILAIALVCVALVVRHH